MKELLKKYKDLRKEIEKYFIYCIMSKGGNSLFITATLKKHNVCRVEYAKDEDKLYLVTYDEMLEQETRIDTSEIAISELLILLEMLSEVYNIALLKV